MFLFQVDDRLKELEDVNTFTDFVQAFSEFGADMVELAHLSGDRQNVSTLQGVWLKSSKIAQGDWVKKMIGL